MNVEHKATSIASLHVLMVDDDSFMLELVSEMLRDLGVERITTALDGKRGFDAFTSAKRLPDLIICDINMPGKDGFQFMELIAGKNYSGAVVLISGMEGRIIHSAELMARFHHLKVLGSLQKPVSRALLATLLEKAVET